MSQDTAVGAAVPAEDDADLGPLMTPGEVAKLFHVNPKTVTRWAQDGRLSSVRTLGGHRRFRAAEVHALLAQSATPGAS